MRVRQGHGQSRDTPQKHHWACPVAQAVVGLVEPRLGTTTVIMNYFCAMIAGGYDMQEQKGLCLECLVILRGRAGPCTHTSPHAAYASCPETLQSRSHPYVILLYRHGGIPS